MKRTAWAAAVAFTAALGAGTGAARAAVPTPNCVHMTAMFGATMTVAAPAQYAVDVVFTNQSSFLCRLQGFPTVVLSGPNGTTYAPVAAAAKRAVVEVQPGMSAHVRLTYLTGKDADACDPGGKWVPTSLAVTLPVVGAGRFELPWSGPKVDNCQGGATHPGTYIGAIEPGDGASTVPGPPPLSHDVCVPYRQALAIAAQAATFQGDAQAGRAQEQAWQEALRAVGQQVGYRPAVAAALGRLGKDPAVGRPPRGTAARDRDLAAVAAHLGTGCARGLPRTAAQIAIAEGVIATNGLPAACADIVDVKQSRLNAAYATAALVVDRYLFGVACNFQGGDNLLRRSPTTGWSVISTATERPCAVKGVPVAVLRELYGSRCRT